MSVKGYQATKDRESREKIAKEDREQRERESKRDFIKGLVPKVQFKFGKGSASNSNHPEWYKKWMQKYLSKFTSIPVYVDVTVGRVPVTGGYGNASSILTGYNTGTQQLVNSVRYGAGKKLVNTTYNGQVHVAVHEFLPHLGYVDQNQIDASVNGGMPGAWRDKYPINITTLQTYGNMGKVNSRAIDADISIYGMYTTAAIDLYAFASELKCVIDVYDKYQMNNNAMPRAILLAKGYDPDKFLAKIADWRKVYAQVSEMLNTTIPLPANLTLLARRIWLNSVIIKDSDNDKAPLMTFKQVSFGLLSEDGTEIEYKSFLDYPMGGIGSGHPVRILTPDDCLAWFQYAARRVTQSDDFTTLIANMRASIGKFYVLPSLEDKASNIISINDDVKLQMQNIVTLPAYYGDKFALSKTNDLPVGHAILNAIDQWRVFQNGDGSMQQETNFVVATLTAPATGADVNAWFRFQFGMYACTEMSVKLNSFVGWDDDKFLVATRLHPIMRGYNNLKEVSGTYYPELHLVLAACGTEIVTATNLIGSYPDPQNNNERKESFIARINTDIMNSNASSSTGGQAFTITIGYPENIHTLLPQIDGLYPVITTAVNTSLTYYHASGTFASSSIVRLASITQLDDYIYIEDIDLASIHEISVKSEYYLDEADFGKGFIKR